jgi:hypothetical protein
MSVRIPYKKRLEELVKLVEAKGEISLNELIIKWSLEPGYIKRLIKMALLQYPSLEFENEVLKLKREKK